MDAIMNKADDVFIDYIIPLAKTETMKKIFQPVASLLHQNIEAVREISLDEFTNHIALTIITMVLAMLLGVFCSFIFLGSVSFITSCLPRSDEFDDCDSEGSESSGESDLESGSEGHSTQDSEIGESDDSEGSKKKKKTKKTVKAEETPIVQQPEEDNANLRKRTVQKAETDC